MIILLHSSKTMRFAPLGKQEQRPPQLLEKARQLGKYLKTLSPAEIAKIMEISSVLEEKTQTLISKWKANPEEPSLAIDSFIGDIYSGFQALNLSGTDRDYADQSLYILSGLYGIIRPYDAIYPYRLEMGYKFPDKEFASLYTYWKDSIASCLPKKGTVVNLASGEYSKVITPFIDKSRIVTPKFLTRNSKSNEPTFVVVHAKIAKGAFARWLITQKIQEENKLTQFKDLGYHFDPGLSSSNNPVFVCDTFGGKGLSIKKIIIRTA